MKPAVASRQHARCARPLRRLPCPVVQPPATGDSWLGLTDQPLPVAVAYEWCIQPQCGAVVLFSGTVRDHSLDHDGTVRDGVEHLTYEAYDEQVIPRFEAITGEVRARWPHTGRIALLHRTGVVALGDSSVIACVSAPHRAEAFEAARYAIDALKASAPIWKHEEWEGGSDWGTAAHPVVDAANVPTAQSTGR